MKILALLVVLVVAAFAQDANRVFNTTAEALAGVRVSERDAVVLSGAAKELASKVDLTVPEVVRAAIRMGIEKDPEIAELMAQLENPLTPLDALSLIRNFAQENATKAGQFLALYKLAVASNVSQAAAAWLDRVANLSAVREIALDSTKTFAERAKAVLVLQVSKVEQRKVAANLVFLDADGELRQLSERAALAAVFLINNTIALRNGSKVGELAWNPLNSTILKARLFEILMSVKMAEWKLNQTVVAIQRFLAENQDAIQELQSKAAEVASDVRKTVEEVRAAWKASAAENQTLSERIERFIDNVTSIDVQITGLDGSGPISVKVDLTRDDLPSDTQAKVEKFLGDAVKAVLVAYTNAKDSDVSATATKTGKRAAGSYSVTSTLTAAAPVNPNTSSSSMVAVSLLGLVSFAVALLF